MTAIFLTTAAADAAVTVGSGTKWKAGWAPGASSRLLNKNTAAAPGSALQVTDSATAGTDGTVVSWYTEPLWGVTIAGQIVCLIWTRESSTASNVAPTIRIERCSGDGTVLSTIVAENTNQGAGEMGTTAGGATDSITCTAINVTDTTLSDGDRLRITLWIDNAADQGGTGSMASGGNAQFYVNGPNGAAGQAQLTFTEQVCPQSGPNIIKVVEGAWADSTSPHDITVTGCVAGDYLIRISGGDGGLSGGGNSVTASTMTTSVGTTDAWVDPTNGKQLPSGGGTGWLHVASALVTADGDITCRATRVQAGTPRAWGGVILLCRNSGGIGNLTFVDTSATETASLGVLDGDAVGFISVDWDALTAATGYTPGGANDIERAIESSNYTVHCAYWLGQTAGTRAYGTNGTTSATNLRSMAIEILPAVAGSTAVGKDLGLKWDTRAAVGDTSQLVWNTRAAIGDDNQLLWSTRAVLGKTLQAVWNTRALAGKGSQLVWNTRSAVGDDLQLIWNVQFGVTTAVGKDLGLVWNTRALAGASSQLVWNTRAVIGKPLQALWSVRSAVGDPLDLRWSVRGVAPSSLALQWSVRQAVGDPLDLRWAVRTFVGDPLDLRWSVRQAVGDDLQLLWDVDSIVPMTQVGKDLGLLWNTRQAVGDSLDLRWSLRQAIFDALSIVWNTRAASGKNLNIVWNVRSIISDTIDLRWGVRTTVGKSGDLRWMVRSAAGKDLVLVWNVETAPYDSVIGPYSALRTNTAIATIISNGSTVTRPNRSGGSVLNPATTRIRPNDAEATPL